MNDVCRRLACLSACAALVLGASVPARAQDRADPYRTGPYATVAAGRTHYEFFGICRGGSCSNLGSNVLRLGGGYAWPIVGAELAYTDYGKASFETDSRHATAVTANLVLRVRPIGSMEISWRLGAGRMKNERVDRGVASTRSGTVRTGAFAVGWDATQDGTLEAILHASSGRKESDLGDLSLLLGWRQRF